MKIQNMMRPKSLLFNVINVIKSDVEKERKYKKGKGQLKNNIQQKNLEKNKNKKIN